MFQQRNRDREKYETQMWSSELGGYNHPNPHGTPQKQEQVKILVRMMKGKRAGDGGTLNGQRALAAILRVGGSRVSHMCVCGVCL